MAVPAGASPPCLYFDCALRCGKIRVISYTDKSNAQRELVFAQVFADGRDEKRLSARLFRLKPIEESELSTVYYKGKRCK
jgi:hypothetical protein